MDPTLPLWVLLVGASTTFSATAPSNPSELTIPRGELERFSAAWSTHFQPVFRQPEPNPDDGNAHVERIEALLATAQTALGALRSTEAEEALDEAERLLRAHPELPQAAWLAAERAELAAVLVEARDPALSRALRQKATLLEGKRAATFRDEAADAAALGQSAPRRLTIRGVSPRDQLEWNAVPVGPSLEASNGEHQLRVIRGQRVVFAGWVTVTAGASEVAVDLPAIAACSADDLQGTLHTARGPVASAGTLCPRWAVARSDGKKLMMALCREAECGPWQSAPPATQPVTTAERPGFPRWIIYAAAGAGAVALTAFVAVQSGAFSSSPTTERWVYGGLR